MNYWQRNGVRLRAFDEKDMEMYLENNHNPDSERQWYYDSIMLPLSREGMKKYYEKFIEENKENDKALLVIETLEGEYAGEALVWFAERRIGLFRYGIFVDQRFQGKGFATDALIMVLDYYFNELNYHKCGPTVYGFNTGSQKFHEKFGFTLEGRAREEVYSRGKYYDYLYYGMLKEEFNRRYQHFQ